MWILGIVIILVLVIIWSQYNKFVKLNNYVKEAFSTMDVFLNKRFELIPNLVECVKGYQTHESKTLEDVTRLRSQYMNSDSNINSKIEANNALNSQIKTLFAVSEAYPELKANTNYIELMKNLSSIEDEIANSRKYYNGCVRQYENARNMFPTSVIAKMFGFKPYSMFEAVEGASNSVKVDL